MPPGQFRIDAGPLNRITPALGPAYFKTYSVRAPLRTHWRPATCAEAGCEAMRNGWVTTVDLGTELGQRQAHHIMTDKTRRFTVQRVSERLMKVIYGPGFTCFASDSHYVRVGRLDHYLVVGGDWRGNPRGECRIHKNGQDWAEDCAEHTSKINTALERG